MKIFQDAKPTYYDGILFRSKSEALFAHLLDLSCYRDIVSRAGTMKVFYSWKYEPDVKNSEGWRPDFKVFETFYDMEKCRAFTRNLLLEYKPGEVPRESKKNLTDAFNKLRECNPDYYSVMEPIEIIVGVNFWLKEYECYLSDKNAYDLVSGEIPFLNIDLIKQASRYRFDLVH